MNWHWWLEEPKTRRGRITTIVVKLVVFALLAVLGVVWLGHIDKADAQPASTPRIVCCGDPGPSTWERLAIMKWKQNRRNLHKSGGRRVPHKAAIKLESYRSNHPSVRPWWKQGLDLGQCMFNSIGSPIWTVTWQSLCLTQGERPTFRHINEQITTIRVVCGGFGVVGFLKNGGEWGAVKGSASCFFPAVVSLYENWLGRRAHIRAFRAVTP